MSSRPGCESGSVNAVHAARCGLLAGWIKKRFERKWHRALKIDQTRFSYYQSVDLYLFLQRRTRYLVRKKKIVYLYVLHHSSVHLLHRSPLLTPPISVWATMPTWANGDPIHVSELIRDNRALSIRPIFTHRSIIVFLYWHTYERKRWMQEEGRLKKKQRSSLQPSSLPSAHPPAAPCIFSAAAASIATYLKIACPSGDKQRRADCVAVLRRRSRCFLGIFFPSSSVLTDALVSPSTYPVLIHPTQRAENGCKCIFLKGQAQRRDGCWWGGGDVLILFVLFSF